MTDMITEAYEAYCLGQVTRVGMQQTIPAIRRLVSALRTEFPSSLEEYQELTCRLSAIWEQSVGRSQPEDFEAFKTSGTTRGASRLFNFGPHSRLWIWTFWQLTRYPFEWRVIFSLNPTREPDQPLTVTRNSLGFCQFDISCGTLNSMRLAELITTLKQLLEEYFAISLLSVPDTFLYLNQQSDFQSFVIENKNRMNLMSWMWEPFYKKRWLLEQGVHISDAMVDWATGLNFYTCSNRQQHVYPIFASLGGRRVNLLNLIPPADYWEGGEEDLFTPTGVTKCGCGRNRLQYHFVPHQSVAMRTRSGELVYDMQLAEQPTSNFQCLQFIQSGNTVAIYYSVDGEFLDQSVLEAYFRQLGFQIEWRPNEVYTTVGPKRLVFLQPPPNGIPR